jgi:hypothetical protein
MIPLLVCAGNIEFESVQVEGVEGSRVVTKAGSSSALALSKCCELMAIDAKALVKSLTFRELQTMAPG